MSDVLTVGEKKLPVRISYKVLKQVPSLSAEGEGQYDSVEKLLFLSLQNGHQFNGQPFTMVQEDIENMIDEYPEVLGQFNSIMAKQMPELVKKMKAQNT